MQLYKPFAQKLISELSSRYEHLLKVLPNCDFYAPDYVECSSSDLRLAVEDFKTILAELKRLR